MTETKPNELTGKPAAVLIWMWLRANASPWLANPVAAKA